MMPRLAAGLDRPDAAQPRCAMGWAPRRDPGVEARGFEPLTSSMRPRRSAGLSYAPKGDRQCTAVHEPARSRLRRSWMTVVVRSDRLRSIRALATSVVRRNPPVMPSG